MIIPINFKADISGTSHQYIKMTLICFTKKKRTLISSKLKDSILFRPKLMNTLKSYSLPQFTKDLMASLIVGIIALPLAIAFACQENPIAIFSYHGDMLGSGVTFHY